MRALWLENQHLSFRTDALIPEAPPGEALVQVRLAGICATDLELLQGYYPYTGILGHEFVGEIVQSDSDELRIGQRVVGEINVVCGQCHACRAGRSAHCVNRAVLGIKNRHGAFAEYLSLPLVNLHPVPENVPDEAAVFCEPLAAALEIQEQVQIHPSDQVLVVGAGRLGQLIARTLALIGCRLSVVARQPRQAALLARKGIATITLEDVPSGGMDIVIEASGSPKGFELARKAVRPRGTLVLKSTYSENATLNLSAVVVDEITLVGSRCGPFQPALALLASSALDPTPLIDARYSLGQGLQAIEEAAQPGVLKLLLQP
jgi:threonine dehydrogenase-like Zn-dependent dehydrogenase